MWEVSLKSEEVSVLIDSTIVLYWGVDVDDAGENKDWMLTGATFSLDFWIIQRIDLVMMLGSAKSLWAVKIGLVWEGMVPDLLS